MGVALKHYLGIPSIVKKKDERGLEVVIPSKH